MRVLLRFAFLAMVASAGYSILAARHRPAPASRPSTPGEYGVVPSFQLLSSSGKTYRRKDFYGRPWVAAFIYTRCGGQCPMVVSRLRELSKEVPGLRLVSMSVDSADRPGVLERFRKAQHATWLFLTGARGKVKRLALEGFRIGVAGHSEKLVLIDALGWIRGYYDGSEPGALSRLAADARYLLGRAEAASSAPPPPRPAEGERHSTTGVVRQVVGGGATLVIAHRAIPGFMEAMTMAYDVADPAAARGIHAGDRVRFSIGKGGKAGEDWKIVSIRRLL